MRVIEQQTFGQPDVLRLVDRSLPPPGPGEVRVKVTAAGVNPVDAFVSTGALPILGDPPFTVGWDVAGVVERLGDGVSGFAPGDRVMGLVRFPKAAGAYADAVNAPAQELAHVPEPMADAQAGGVPLAGLTAWQALVEHGKLRAGERVLITAAGGGVGHIAVQVAEACGAIVWASASAGKHAMLSELGADHLVDRHHLSDDMPRNFDMVLHAVAQTSPLDSLRLIRPGGRVITLPPMPEGAAESAADMGRDLRRVIVRPDAAGLRALGRLADQNKLRVLVAKTFPLAQAGDAHRALADGVIGKIVLIP